MTFATRNLLLSLSHTLIKKWGTLPCRQMVAAAASSPLFRRSDTSHLQAVGGFHTSQHCMAEKWFSEPTEFLKYNDIVYPPQKEGELPRPAMRGMSVDEALKQLQFHPKDKGARICSEVIKEAQEIAVREHNVEYKSNLWIEHAFTERAHMIKGLRKHARGRYSILKYRYLHFFIRLREGSPPEHYYKPKPDGNEKMAEYLQNLRSRRVHRSL